MSNYVILTPDQAAQLDVLFDAILPVLKEVNNPGARKAGVVNYLDALLAQNDLYYEIPSWIKLYKEGLLALEEAAQKHYNTTLSNLDRQQATELLAQLQAGTLHAVAVDTALQKRMFITLWRHCIQGAFSDPKWGGNHDKVMWKWYGYLQEPQQILN